MLDDIRHYTAADQVQGVNADEAKLIIDAIIPLHAKFWDDTDQEILATAMRVDGEYIAGLSPGVEGTWERCVEQFGYCITPDVLPELAAPGCRRCTGRYLLSYPLIIGGAFDPANERGKQLAEEVLRRSSQTVTDRGLVKLIPAPVA